MNTPPNSIHEIEQEYGAQKISNFRRVLPQVRELFFKKRENLEFYFHIFEIF